MLAARPCPFVLLYLLQPSFLWTSSFHTRSLKLSASPSPSPSPLARTRKFFPLFDCPNSDSTLAPPPKDAFSRLPQLAPASATESRSLAKSCKASAKQSSAAENTSTLENLAASQQAKAPLVSQKVSRKRKSLNEELKDNGMCTAETVPGLKKFNAPVLETHTDWTETTLGPQKVSTRKKKDVELNENFSEKAHTESQRLQKVSRRKKKDTELNETLHTESSVMSDNLSLEKLQSVESKNKPDAGLESGFSTAGNTTLRVEGSQKMFGRNKITAEPKGSTIDTDLPRVDMPLVKLSTIETQYVEDKNKQAADMKADLSPVDNLTSLGPHKVSRKKKVHAELQETGSTSPEIDLLRSDSILQTSENNKALSFEKPLGLTKVLRKKRHSEELKTNKETNNLLVENENMSGMKSHVADSNKNCTELSSRPEENTSLREEKIIAGLTSNLTSSDQAECFIGTSSQLSDLSVFQQKNKNPRAKNVALSSFRRENQTPLSTAPATKRTTSSTKHEIKSPFTSKPQHAPGEVPDTIFPTLERRKVSNSEHSSFEGVRAVENSVEKASLMEGHSASSFSGGHSLEDTNPRVKGVKRSFPFVENVISIDPKDSISSSSSNVAEEDISWKPADSPASMGARALIPSTSFSVQEEGIPLKYRDPENMDKADSKSNRNHVWNGQLRSNSANTGKTEQPSSLHDFGLNVSQVTEKRNRISRGECVNENISIKAEGTPSSGTICIPPSEETAGPKNEPISLEVTGLRKKSSVNLAEKKASKTLAEAFPSMSTPDSRLKTTQSQHPAVTDIKFLVNREKAGGMIKTTPKKFAIRNVKANQASTISYMQILGTGFDTRDTVPTVLLFFDRRRFIFNAGEGLHRFCIEHKVKLSKIDHIFLTRVCSETTGGLPGLFLTMAGMGEKGMTAQVWGPSSLQDLVNAMRTFVPSASMVHTHCFGKKEDHDSAALLGLSPPILLVEDELVKISAVLLHPSSCSRGTIENQKDVGSDDEVSHKWACSESDTNQIIPSEEKIHNDVSVAYICELSEVPGKFDPVKARAKGLKPGVKYGKLHRGESVLSDDGLKMVHPEDVLGPSSRGPVMILVDCPSSSHIPALVSASSLQSFFMGAEKVVDCMVHITPLSVTNNKKYQDWARNFSKAHHIIAGRQMEGLGLPVLRSSAKILSKLNLICPQVFPVVGPSEQSYEEISDDKKGGFGRTLIAENLLKFHLRPLSAIGPDRSDVPESFDFIATQRSMMTECSEIAEARDHVTQVWKEQDVGNAMSNLVNGDVQDLPECLQYVTREEMEVVFLGTGSSQPSAYRNVSAVYLHLFKHGGILLDCGEGTYAQLKRRYGAKGAEDVLMGLKCIWISHMHADHHTGLARLLSVRRQLMERKSICNRILVIGPEQLKRFLQSYEKVEDLDMDFLDCNQTTLEAKDLAANVMPNIRNRGLIHLPQGAETNGTTKGQMQYLWKQPGLYLDASGREKLQSALSSLGLKDLLSVHVVHCLNAFGVVLEGKEKQLHGGKVQSGWKLVYSGDTRPCQELIEAARGATILIHEATFDDSMPMEAIMKNHSLTKEAIHVGVTAGVYRIFLTHFSQRYPKIPVFDESYTDRTCIAFDMMSVNLADLPLFPKLLPALKMLFNDELLEDDVEYDLM